MRTDRSLDKAPALSPILTTRGPRAVLWGAIYYPLPRGIYSYNLNNHFNFFLTPIYCEKKRGTALFSHITSHQKHNQSKAASTIRRTVMGCARQIARAVFLQSHLHSFSRKFATRSGSSIHGDQRVGWLTWWASQHLHSAY